MTEGFITPIRKTLFEVVDAQLQSSVQSGENIKAEMKLRPPKNEAWGDLCTNVLLLMTGDDMGARAEMAPTFITALETLPMVQSAALSDSGYINLQIKGEFWGSQMLAIVGDGMSYGLQNSEPGSNLVLQEAETAEDLLSARHSWNVEALVRLASLAGWQVTFEPWAGAELKGFPTAPAFAKCTERVVRLSMLSSGNDFAVHFSPMLAADKAYSNPAFCIPFAQSRIGSLLDQLAQYAAESGGDIMLTEALDDISFSLPLEQKIAKFLCDWPRVVEQCLENRDMVYLTAFLHDLSLLFFQLLDQERLQSSDYLYAAGQKTARKLLLQAVDILIRGGMEILGIDIVEEFV